MAAGGKTAKFTATLNLPKTASTKTPVAVIIATDGIDNTVFLKESAAVVTFDYQTIASDSNAKPGAFWSLYSGRDIGTLLAWAWGFHRTLDGISLAVPEIDGSKVAVTGCSRLEKAAVAARLFDTRINLTMAMSSGIQGLGLYRYYALSGQDETLEISNQGAPWWD